MPDDNRPCNVQGGSHPREPGKPYTRFESCTIPWWLAEIAYRGYSMVWSGSQTLERLNERGGFGREELVLCIQAAAGKDKEEARRIWEELNRD